LEKKWCNSVNNFILILILFLFKYNVLK
jgi:hypothetical protein